MLLDHENQLLAHAQEVFLIRDQSLDPLVQHRQSLFELFDEQVGILVRVVGLFREQAVVVICGQGQHTVDLGLDH
jgi:hypothetical protein